MTAFQSKVDETSVVALEKKAKTEKIMKTI